jgi:hypothetical protein
MPACSASWRVRLAWPMCSLLSRNDIAHGRMAQVQDRRDVGRQVEVGHVAPTSCCGRSETQSRGRGRRTPTASPRLVSYTARRAGKAGKAAFRVYASELHRPSPTS